MQPTRTRFRVAGFLMLLAAVTYLDRVCISVLAPNIQRDFGLSKEQMGLVFSAFAVAYAGFELVSAWWGERIGARRVLTRIVIWWSCFTMATGSGVELCQPARDPFPVRRGRGGRVAERGAGVLELDPAEGARPDAGLLLRRGAPLRRDHAAAGGRDARLDVVARDLHGLRRGGVPLVGRLVRLVPRRASRAQSGQRRRGRADRGRAARRAARPLRRGPLAGARSASRPCGSSAWRISRTATARTS